MPFFCIKGNDKTLAVLIIVTAVTVAFLPSLGNGFTNYDDNAYLTQNPLVRSLTLENVRQIFYSTQPHTIFVPMVTLSFALEYKLWGMNPAGYHASNLILHVSNTLLIFYLLYGIFSRPFLALGSALLFGVHPLRVESVAWITERKDLLMVFFLLLAMHAYRRYLKKYSRRHYLFSLALFSLAIFSKPSALILPLLLLPLDLVLENKITRKRWLEKIAFAIVGIFAVILNSASFSANMNTVNSQKIPVIVNNIFYCLPFYLQKTILPGRLSVRYPTDMRFFMPPLWLSLTLAIILIGITLVALRQSPKVWLWGWSFFFIALVPTYGVLSNFFPITDRYSYLPAIGLAIVLVEFVYTLQHKMGEVSKLGEVLILSACIFFLFFLGLKTFNRTKVWKDSLSLWNDVIAKYSMIPAAYNNRGTVLRGLGRLEEAMHDYGEAIRLLPENPEAFWNRGLVWLQEGQNEKADQDIVEAIKRDSAYFSLFCQTANARYGAYGFQFALNLGERVVQVKPDSAIHAQLAGLYVQSQQYEKAEMHLKEAVRLSPQSAEYRRLLTLLQSHLK